MTHESYLCKHILPELGHETVGGLKPQAVQQFLNSQTKLGPSPRTVGQIWAILRLALAETQRWGYVERNAATLVKPPRVGKQEVESLTGERARRLAKATVDDRLGGLFAVALHTGLRQGELLAL